MSYRALEILITHPFTVQSRKIKFHRNDWDNVQGNGNGTPVPVDRVVTPF